MTKVLTNSQGKIYINQAGKALVSKTVDTITATNNTGSAISAGDKVWINENSGSYSIENLVVPKMSQHFTRVSSLVIDNMIASSFSQSSYICETQHIDFTKPWEFNTAVGLGTYSENQFIYITSNTNQSNLFNAAFILFGSSILNNNKGFSFQGSTDFQLNLAYNWEVGVLYYVKCGWTGTEYYLGVSTDGRNYTYATPYSSTTPCQAIDNTFNLGGNNGWTTYYLYGTLDLSKTYIINNGEIVWSPYTTDSLTGYAQENIAIGSTGDVKTVLGA